MSKILKEQEVLSMTDVDKMFEWMKYFDRNIKDKFIILSEDATKNWNHFFETIKDKQL